jgi:hypothetical protein
VNHGPWVHEGPHEPAETPAVRASASPARSDVICRRSSMTGQRLDADDETALASTTRECERERSAVLILPEADGLEVADEERQDRDGIGIRVHGIVGGQFRREPQKVSEGIVLRVSPSFAGDLLQRRAVEANVRAPADIVRIDGTRDDVVESVAITDIERRQGMYHVRGDLRRPGLVVCEGNEDVVSDPHFAVAG